MSSQLAAVSLTTKQTDNNFDGLADFFNRMDSFDPSLFMQLFELVKDELPPTNENETHYYNSFEKMLDEIKMLVNSKKQ